MGKITHTESKFLTELVKDCITYGLTENEAIEYIEKRFKKISVSSYTLRKANVLNDESTKIWLNHFTRIGFVKNHQDDVETIRKLRDDSMRQLHIETDKGNQNRDEYKILKLKQDIRDNTRLLSELNLGTPIISAIKAKVEGNNRNETSLSVT
jgi:hypothetical protein